MQRSVEEATLLSRYIQLLEQDQVENMEEPHGPLDHCAIVTELPKFLIDDRIVNLTKANMDMDDGITAKMRNSIPSCLSADSTLYYKFNVSEFTFVCI